jgi:uncharacterized repeat protein (TIGR01451 family)
MNRAWQRWRIDPIRRGLRMTKLRTLRIALFFTLVLGTTQAASAFVAGGACVSPYAIADGDVDSLRAAVICTSTDSTDSVIELANQGLYVFAEKDPSNNQRALPNIGGDGLFTLLGHGATLRRDPSSPDTFGILEIFPGADADLQDVTLSGGSVVSGLSGGGIRVRGIARATSIRVVDNTSSSSGGGIFVASGGKLVLTDSAVENNTSATNGGGIRTTSGTSLWVLRSTIKGNTVSGNADGGGIRVEGLARIVNSTIIENQVLGPSQRGGGLAVNDVADVIVVNSTIFDNVSPLDGEQLRRGAGSLSVYNSIVGESAADAVADCSNVTTVVDTLVEDGSCSAPITGDPNFLAPGIGANGTEILPLSFGSGDALAAANGDWLDEDVVNADLNGDGDLADDLALDIEQSGKQRTTSMGIDLGAVAYVCGAPVTYYPATGSELAEAISCANIDGVDSTIEMISDRYTLTTTSNTDGGLGGNGLPVIVDDGNLAINGHQAILERDASASDFFRLLHVATNADTVIVNDLAIQGGTLNGGGDVGGGIYNTGNLQLHRSVIRGNSTDGLASHGGGIENLGHLLLDGSLIDSNAILGDFSEGGGLDNRGQGVAVLVNSTITRNAALLGTGGGVLSLGADSLLVFVNSTIADNETDGLINEVYVSDGEARFFNTLVKTASGSACGGGGSTLNLVVENGMANDPNCGATYTADPQLDAFNEDAFVGYYPLSGANVDAVETGYGPWLDESVVGVDLNGDGDTSDDLQTDNDQAGHSRIRCMQVDLGAVEYDGCDAIHTVGGTVNGLATGNSVSITLNGSATIEVMADGSVTFPVPLGYGQSYFVSVSAQPTSPNQTCTVTNASGRVANVNVTSVLVDCVTNQYTVGGTISGLAAGSHLVLRNNGGDDLTVSSVGAFVFPTVLDDGSGYAVTVFAQPTDPSQFCTVANGSGTLSGVAISDVAVTCVPLSMDLVASITDGLDAVGGGGALLSYTIVISNQGPAAATGAIVQTALSSGLINANWTCSAGPGASCPASGSGGIDVLVDLASGTSVTFTLTAEVSPGFMDIIQSSVGVTAPDGFVEVNLADNEATDQTATDRLFADGFEAPPGP